VGLKRPERPIRDERATMSKIKVVGFVLSCLFLMPLSAWPDSVTIKNGRMSADLKEAPLAGVTKDIEKQSGISFKGDESFLEEKISVSFKDLSVEEGIRRMLANMNYSLMFDNQGEVSEVMIMSEKTGAGALQPQVRPASAVPPSPTERRPVVRRPRTSSPLVPGGTRTPAVRPQTTPPRTSPQRAAPAVPAASRAAEEANLPEAFRGIENPPSPEEGPLPPAFRAIENAEPAGKAKSTNESSEAPMIKKNVPLPAAAAESQGEKPGETNASQKDK
jgi:hypothetical protein